MTFPPLWGKNSFNWGAGMHQMGNAAGFIKANMPLGLGGTLTDPIGPHRRDANNAAVRMLRESFEQHLGDRGLLRYEASAGTVLFFPQDPRFTGSVEATRQKFHDSADSMYGHVVNGLLLGARQ